MTAIEKVAPSNVQLEGFGEVTFYVSPDARKTGISLRGLQRLCGLGESTLIEALGKSIPKWLEALQVEVFWCSVEGTDGARIVTEEAAVAIIEYYAFESKAKNSTALSAYRAFAKMGFASWVKKISGYREVLDTVTNTEVLDMMKELLHEVKELKTEVQEYKDIRKVTVTVYPGLDYMLDQIPNTLGLPSGAAPENAITVKQWLAQKGVTLQFGKLVAFGRLVADTYKSMTGKEPQFKYETVNGRSTKVGKGYAPEHLVVLETAWKQFSA